MVRNRKYVLSVADYLSKDGSRRALMGRYALAAGQLQDPCFTEVSIPFAEALDIGCNPKTFEAIKKAKSFCEGKHCGKIRDCGAYKGLSDLYTKEFSVVDRNEQRKKLQAVA